ncbi:MAG: hypothetical protein C5B46_09660 [Proteobacteria bacterium]|nr:MAG: hypothetical protein C5B46_09660 [Pseudomonadota bacterium]
MLDTGDTRIPAETKELVRDEPVAAASRSAGQAEDDTRVDVAVDVRRNSVVTTLAASLIAALRPGIHRVLVRQPVKLSESLSARPDICVLRDRGAATPQDGRQSAVELIIDVANAADLQHTLDKLEDYARAGVPEVWIVDLARQRILVYQVPSGHSFAKRQLLVAPERVTLLAGADLKVAWIFGEGK